MVARTLLVDRIVDMMEEGLDVAVRIAHLPSSGLSAVRVGQVRRAVCASPDYLARHGVPRALDDLERHDAILFAPGAAAPDWSFPARGRSVAVRPRAQLIVNTVEVTIAGAVAGRGLTRALLPDRAGAGGGTVADRAGGIEPPPLPIHVVHAEGRRAAARVRAFVDFAVERLRADKALQ